MQLEWPEGDGCVSGGPFGGCGLSVGHGESEECPLPQAASAGAGGEAGTVEDEGTLVFPSSCCCRGEAGLVTPSRETEVEDW